MVMIFRSLPLPRPGLQGGQTAVVAVQPVLKAPPVLADLRLHVPQGFVQLMEDEGQPGDGVGILGGGADDVGDQGDEAQDQAEDEGQVFYNGHGRVLSGGMMVERGNGAAG